MSADSVSLSPAHGRLARVRSLRVPKPELFGLIGLAAVLNLWGLSVNGWANTYYSAAVRSMSSSWHNFLYASMDPSGLMTVDKPPLSLWVQALSARVFGFHPLSLLVPQALMGAVAVALVYDLVRRHFGRVAGFVGGLTLALTPVAVAVSRHNNPDELLALCCVAALWFAVRAFETGRTKWLVLSGIAVGLGFETKMGVALMVVPGIALAWLWARSEMGGKLRAFGQLLAGGGTMLAVGLAWPLLVTLTPAADRPWISGTSDNSIWSLIFGYNGLGRVAGQTGGPPGVAGGGPGGGGGTLFGGQTGVFRLLQSGLGDQAGWLLGAAIVAGLALLVSTRLRRGDARTPWLIAVGGAFIVSAVTFSFASGIFHPYYVSLIAPLTALLVGAGVALMLPAPWGRAASSRSARIVGPLVIAGAAVTELVVLGNLSGGLAWAVPIVIVGAPVSGAGLATGVGGRPRLVLAGAAATALLAAPATWAAETLGHATNGTFPTGGPQTAMEGGPPSGGRGGFGGGFGGFGGGPVGGGPPAGAPPGGAPPAGTGLGRPPAGAGSGGPPGSLRPGGGGAPAAGGGPFGENSGALTAAVKYARAHGGGTIGVSSQSSAASAIVSTHGAVAGLGGFSGRESSISASWLAAEISSGHLRWIMSDQTGGPRLAGDTRTGSQSALSLATNSCKSVKYATGTGTKSTMYDCLDRSAAILKAGGAKA